MRGGVAKYIWVVLFVAFVGGFLLADMSGLVGMTGVTPNTVVAKVNGEEIPYLTWENLTRQLVQQQEQQTGRATTMDERLQLEQQAFDQLVTEILLRQEYERRGIHVTDAEIVTAARNAPPPQFLQAPELLTEGRFDPDKYQRFLNSPVARQQGLLAQLEAYYRSEIPRAKLFSQLAAETWISDDALFQVYRDERDTARVAYVSFRPSPAQVEAAQVSDAEARRYYEQYKGRWNRPGRALASVISVTRIPAASDSARVLARARALRQEIVSGAASFADVARRESEDSVSAADGGSLGRGPRGRFVASFENAAFNLRLNEVSQPVLTEFGYHLIQPTERKGDTLAVRHILLRVAQGDSTATMSDRAADRLAAIAAGASDPAKFDQAAQELNLLVTQVPLQEGQTAAYQARGVRGISGWAFSGSRVGEISDLIDDESGYYLVRLDSLTRGGDQPFEAVRADIIQALKERKSVEGLQAQAEAFLAEARATSLADAARKSSFELDTTRAFNRASFVEGLGFSNQAVGAAFGLPVGDVALVKTVDAIFVMQVVERREAARGPFEEQKADLRRQLMANAREDRLRQWLEYLRRDAEIVDRRIEVNAQLRQQVIE